MRKFPLLSVVGVLGLVSCLLAQQDGKNQPKEPAFYVPYVPTEEKVVEAMLKLAGVKEGDTVYDLGCGDGRIIISAVKEFKAGKGLGIDINIERLRDCEERMKTEKLTEEQCKKLKFKRGDVLKMTPEDFKDVDVVTMYLAPMVNQYLKPILLKGLKPGARIVSHDFNMGDWEPEKTEKMNVKGPHTLYLWTIK
jgi:cyclopropane fatty-acyl-phospholipid synthase-like methyltransferase